MLCAKCQAGVPDESLFCLRCGARLAPSPALAPRNGGGGAPRAAPPEVVTVPVPTPVLVAPPATGPGGKQAYALSFRALADERLRYRVARWVCEQAPAHGLTEVQASLLRGDFTTFLAMTGAEAEAARQRIQALGAHPALWRLAPATVAELMLPERPARKAKAAPWSLPKKLAAVGIGLAALFFFGFMAAQRYQAPPPSGPSATVPRIGGGTP
jgi:hypothetical protein